MNIKTILALTCMIGMGLVAGAQTAAVTAAPTDVAAGETVTFKGKPGALLMLYKLENTPVPGPEAEPLTAFVDTSDKWSGEAVSQNAEARAFGRMGGFLVWSGYLSIPEKNTYSFNLTSFYDGGGLNGAGVTFMLNGKVFIKVAPGGTQTRSVSLDKGFYEVSFITKSSIMGLDKFSNRDPEFRLRYNPKKNPLKKTFVTPANLYHAE